jgi:hypothetical protein
LQTQRISERRNFVNALRNLLPRLLIVLALIVVSPVQAATSCHNINAKGVGQDLGGGVTRADIKGGGLLQGTTVGNFAITGIAGTVATIEGIVTFTTNQASLSVTVAGTLDVATGEFDAAGSVTNATGKLAGATGDLVFAGVENLSDGSFVEDVTGSICIDLAP